MFYKLLGMFVWKVGRAFLRLKYGPTHAPTPAVIAAAVVLVGLVVGLLFAKRDSD